MPLEDKVGAGQPQRANTAYAISDDEISLRDLWEIIAKRKWLVFLSTVVCLGLATAYVSLATTVYESRAMVQIGKVAGQSVDNGLRLASRLMNQYTEQAKKQMPKLYAVTPDKADGSILTLEAQGRSPQEAQQYLQGVIQRLLAKDQQRYQQIVGARRAQLTQLQAQYQRMRTSLDTKSGKGQINSTSALLLLEQFRRTDALTSVQVSIAKMENALAPNDTSPTVQTLSPRYNTIPVAPRRGLILVLAGLGGLMLGVFLAFLPHAFRKQPA